MKNKIVTLLCIMTILITTCIAAAGGRSTMTFSSLEADGKAIQQFLNDSEFSTKTSDSEQLLPMVGDDDIDKSDNANVLTKQVTVKNISNNSGNPGESLFIRTTFAFEAGDITDTNTFDDIMYILFNETKYERDDQYYDYWSVPDYDQWKLISIKDKSYYMVTAVYTNELVPGETTVPSLLKIGMERTVTNDQAAGFGDEYEIYIYTEAGTDDDSFSIFSANEHPWMNSN